jgi:hypothetical protein
MNSPRERRKIRLRGLWPRDPGAATGYEQQRVDSSVAHRRLRTRQTGAALPRNDRFARRGMCHGAIPSAAQPRAVLERMNSPLERRKIRLRGLWPRDPGAAARYEQQRVDSSVAHRRLGAGEAGAALPRNDRFARRGMCHRVIPEAAQPRAVCGASRSSSRGFTRPGRGLREASRNDRFARRGMCHRAIPSAAQPRGVCGASRSPSRGFTRPGRGQCEAPRNDRFA